MLEIQPIDAPKQQEVKHEVSRYIRLASQQYHRRFADIDVVFNLRGKTAGIYRVYRDKGLFGKVKRQIRFNPWLFSKYAEDSWRNTVPHEVAHYIADCRYGLANIKPHGVEWQQIMRDFDAVPKVRANYDLTGIPTRNIRRYDYACGCREVEFLDRP